MKNTIRVRLNYQYTDFGSHKDAIEFLKTKCKNEHVSVHQLTKNDCYRATFLSVDDNGDVFFTYTGQPLVTPSELELSV